MITKQKWKYYNFKCAINCTHKLKCVCTCTCTCNHTHLMEQYVLFVIQKMFPVLCLNVRNVKVFLSWMILVLIIFIVAKNAEKKILIVLWKDTQLRLCSLIEHIAEYTYCGKEKKKEQLVEKELTSPQRLTHLKDKLQNFPRHRYVTHTTKTYDQATDAFSVGTIIKIQDLSENCPCLLPNEIMSIHWTQEQATVFPVVALKNVNNCVWEDHFAFMSDDLNVPFIEICNNIIH